MASGPAADALRDFAKPLPRALHIVERKVDTPALDAPGTESNNDEVAALPMKGRRRLYTADLRRRVIALVEKRIAAGGSKCKASVELGRSAEEPRSDEQLKS